MKSPSYRSTNILNKRSSILLVANILLVAIQIIKKWFWLSDKALPGASNVLPASAAVLQFAAMPATDPAEAAADMPARTAVPAALPARDSVMLPPLRIGLHERSDHAATTSYCPRRRQECEKSEKCSTGERCRLALFFFLRCIYS